MGDGTMCHYCRRYTCCCRVVDLTGRTETPPSPLELCMAEHGEKNKFIEELLMWVVYGPFNWEYGRRLLAKAEEKGGLTPRKKPS